MAGLRIVTFVAICITSLSICVVCRPASDDATDFAIDDAPVAEPGSGVAEKTLPIPMPGVILAQGSGDEGPGAGSAEEDGEDDIASSGEELISGSASGASGIDVEIAPGVNKSTLGFTTVRKDFPSSTTVRSEASSTTDLAGASSTTFREPASSTSLPETVSSTTVREVVSSATPRETTSSTTARETTSSTTARETTSSTTARETTSSATAREAVSSTTSTLDGVFIDLEDESGSGVEDDPEPDVITEIPEDVVSGSGIGWPLEETTDWLTTDRPSKGVNVTDIPTLSPELEIKEGLIPVTAAKTPIPTHANKTMVVSSVPTTTLRSSTEEAFVSTSITSTPAVEKSGETTSESSSSSTGLPVEVDGTTSEEETVSSTHAQNHTRHIEGRRRRPSHHGTTPEMAYEDVSVAEAKKKEDDGKKVSYFAVIAAALISAIVFFVLGYLASILKNKRRKITLPWKKDRVTLEASAADTGNGSATQVYRDTNPDRLTSVYDPVDPGSGKPKQNGSSEKMPTNDLAEVHPKPSHMAEPDADHVAKVSAPNEASPNVSTPSEEVAPAATSQNTADEMKYIDETDDDMDAPGASTPLLPGQSQEEGERGDLAAQVLSTVDKNLNTDSDTKAPLLTDSNKDVNSKSAGSPGNPPPV